MLRRFVGPILAAVALAGVMLLPSPAVAQGRPTYLICEPDPFGMAMPPILIKWEAGGMPEAVKTCVDSGGHPAGVDNRTVPPLEEIPIEDKKD